MTYPEGFLRSGRQCLAGLASPRPHRTRTGTVRIGSAAHNVPQTRVPIIRVYLLFTSSGRPDCQEPQRPSATLCLPRRPVRPHPRDVPACVSCVILSRVLQKISPICRRAHTRCVHAYAYIHICSSAYASHSFLAVSAAHRPAEQYNTCTIHYIIYGVL